jgi:acetyl esterase/lipase
MRGGAGGWRRGARSCYAPRVPADAPIVIPYGPAPQQLGHLRLPPGDGLDGPVPVVVNLHGGFWRARYDLAHAGPACAALTAALGVATWNLEYRRLGREAPGCAGTLDDVRAGYRALAALAARHRLDLGRVVVVGHSAGGQLALYLAAHEPALRGAVALAGVIDLDEAWRLGLSDDPAESAVAAFLGGAPTEVPERYAAADPLRLAIRPPQRLLHGSLDDVVPPAISRGYADAKARRGEDVRLVEIAGADHFDVIAPAAPAWATVVDTVAALLDLHRA